MSPFIWAESDLEDIGRRIQVARTELRGEATREVAEDVGEIVLQHIRDEAPEGRTSKLRNTLSYRVGLGAGFTGRGYWTVNVYSPEGYTRWVIGGRGWVYPVRAKALHWVTKGGQDVFAMSAKPTKPNPFHERGWQKARPAVRARWELYAGNVVKMLGD